MSSFPHGGNVWWLGRQSGVPVDSLLDFSANINPLGMPEWVRGTINAVLDEIAHYPDPDCTDLVSALASRHRAAPENILVANGSAEVLSALPRIRKGGRAVIPVPSYVDYRTVSEAVGLQVIPFPLSPDLEFRLDTRELRAELQPEDIVFLGQPNNPTGEICSPVDLRMLAGTAPDCLFVVDEAFIDFVQDVPSLINGRPPNVVVMRSFTKILAIPGLRLGYLVADSEIVRGLRALLPPWSVNHLAQRVGVAALSEESDFLGRTRRMVREEREYLSGRLRELASLKVFPSHANFLLVKLTEERMGAKELAARLMEQGRIAIRVCENYEGLDDSYFRVAVRPRKDADRLCDAIDGILHPARRLTRRPRAPKPKPALMFQGTSSDAGKSVMTAAFCRILLQDGYRPAPFKAQNMSLNSFVTATGGEMGRAQVTQAQACRLDPDVRMNPVLLKPNSDTGSQVVVLGKAMGNMSVGAYVDYKSKVFDRVKEAYDALANEHDVVVLEGAGSPAEVNLRSRDIVNMAMAHHANAQVVLVGDIDRGGVFASLVGTMELLAPWERALVCGYVLNRFRGKEELLGDALRTMRERTNKPVLGVIPYLTDLGLPEEDSVALSRRELHGRCPEGACVDIAVVQVPHLSNFTDFDALQSEPDAHVRFVSKPDELGRPDVLVLPGSKNVLGDLAHLRALGWIERVRCLAEEGKTELIGICGGFQLLGQRVRDPLGVESGLAEAVGFGLLPVHTTMAHDKTLAQTSARHLASGHSVRGYEIHHGKTEIGTARPILRTSDGTVLGVEAPRGRIWGTYLHGIFDADEFRRWFLDEQRRRKGLDPLGAVQVVYDLEPALDRLAEVVRSRLDIPALYRRVGL